MTSPSRRVAALLSLLALVVPSAADFTKSCPAVCECKWVSGKRQAECSDVSLTAIPEGLSSEIQVLDVSGTAIETLPKDAFLSTGLEHLQKLYMGRSRLREIHKHAFRGLHLLIMLDLSNNAIDKLHTDTFADNEKLRQLILSGNPLRQLTAFQFPAMPHLQMLDLSDCQINSISPKAFSNLDRLEKLRLNGNRLAVLDADVFQSLTNLKWLPLDGNPWRCDCHLRLLRDWLVDHGLYQQATTCAEPERLIRQSWSETDSREFACRPEINIPNPTVTVEPGQNVTLRCQISGNPAPNTKWVMSGRVVFNNTKIPYSGQTYTIHEQGTVNRWTALTVSRVSAPDAGNYLCVGTNPGGVVERNVTVEVLSGGAAVPAAPDQRSPAAGPLSRTVLLALVGGAAALLLVVLLTVCWCCCKRRCRQQPDKPVAEEPPPAVAAPHRLGDYEKVPQTDIEMERVRTPAVLTLPRRPPAALPEDEQDPRSRRYSLPDSPMTWDGRRARDYPDLLHLPRRGGRSSPAGSSSSTQPDQSRLLPPAGPPRLALVTPSRSGGRPGYVTLPRRQRTTSWDNRAGRQEPVYDSLGPRTTADGSSRLSISSAGTETLPPYYVPVEAAETPQRRTSSSRTPHNLSADLIEPLREEDEWEETSPTGPSPHVSGLPPVPQPHTNGRPQPHTNGRPQHTNGLPEYTNGLPERISGLPSTPPQQDRPRKATPPVAPKPKKITPPVMPKPIVNGTHVIAFQDEGEDGTEV